MGKRTLHRQLNLSTTASLGTEESVHCREVETRVNVWTVRQKKWPLRRVGRLSRFEGTCHFFINLHNFKVQILDATFYAGSEHTTASFPFRFLFEIDRGALCICTIRKYYVHLENWSSSNNRDELTRIHFTDDAFTEAVDLYA